MFGYLLHKIRQPQKAISFRRSRNWKKLPRLPNLLQITGDRKNTNMLLVIHNLPPHFNFKNIRSLIKDKCGIHSVILDNLIGEGQSSRVTVGLPDEHQAAILIDNLNGAMVHGYQLYVKDVRKNPVSPQQYRNAQDQSNHSFNDDIKQEHHMYNDTSLSYDAPMPLLVPILQESIPAKPTYQGMMNMYNQQGDQARFASQSQFFGSDPNQSDERFHLQQQTPYHQSSNNNMNYSSDRNSFMSIKNEPSSTNDHLVLSAFDSGRDRDRSSRSDHRDFERSDQNDRFRRDRSRSPQRPVQRDETRERNYVYSQNKCDQRSHNSPPRLTESIKYARDTPYNYAEANKNYTETQFNKKMNCVESVSSYTPNQGPTQMHPPKNPTEIINEASRWNQNINYGNQTSNAPHTSFEEESFIQDYTQNKFENASLSKNLTPFMGEPKNIQVIQQYKRNEYKGNVPKIAYQPKPHVNNQGNVSKMGYQAKPNTYNQGHVPNIGYQPKPHVYNQGNVSKMGYQPKPNTYKQGNVPNTTPQFKPNMCNRGDVSEVVQNVGVADKNTQLFHELCTQVTSEIINGLQLNLDKEPEEYRQTFMRILNKVISYRVVTSCKKVIITSKDVIMARYNQMFPAHKTAKRLDTMYVQARFECNLPNLDAEKANVVPMVTETNIEMPKSNSEIIATQKKIQKALIQQGKQAVHKNKMMKYMALSCVIAAEMSYIERVGMDIQEIFKVDTLTPCLNFANPFNIIEIHACNEFPTLAKLEAYLKPFHLLGLRKFAVKNIYMAALRKFTPAKRLVGVKSIAVGNKQLLIKEFMPGDNVTLEIIYLYHKHHKNKLTYDQLAVLDHFSKLLTIKVFKENDERQKNNFGKNIPVIDKQNTQTTGSKPHTGVHITADKVMYANVATESEKKGKFNAQVTPNKPNINQDATNTQNAKNKSASNVHITADKVIYADVATEVKQESNHEFQHEHDNIEEVNFDELEDY